jgi:DNA-binding NarL/FixJ family response regulator
VTGVLLADDQTLVRSGLRLILEAQPGLRVVGEAADGREAVEQTRLLRPDVVLMDVRMPVMDGIEATRRLALSDQPARIVMLTTFERDEYVYRALRAGASGFLLKTTQPAELAAAVHAVAAGDTLLAPSITRRLVEDFARRPPPGPALPDALAELTAREVEVLRLVAEGLANREIAARLVLGEATIKTHVNRILSKLDLRDRVHAVVIAYETGLVRPGEHPAAALDD